MDIATLIRFLSVAHLCITAIDDSVDAIKLKNNICCLIFMCFRATESCIVTSTLK